MNLVGIVAEAALDHLAMRAFGFRNERRTMLGGGRSLFDRRHHEGMWCEALPLGRRDGALFQLFGEFQ